MIDQDYRNEMKQRFLNLATAPPPPPPPVPIQSIAGFGGAKPYAKRPPGLRRTTIEVPTSVDNVESVDMELSDDDAKKYTEENLSKLHGDSININNKRINITNTSSSGKKLLTNNLVTQKQSVNSGECTSLAFTNLNDVDGLDAVSPDSNYTLAALESPPIPPSLEDDMDETANDILETINQEDFFEGLPEIESEDIDQKESERKWYDNQWNTNDKPHDINQPPPNVPPPDFSQRPPPNTFQRPPPDFCAKTPPAPPPRPSFPGTPTFNQFPTPHIRPPPEQNISQNQHYPVNFNGQNQQSNNFFRGNNRGTNYRGFNRGWGNKIHNNRGGGHTRGGGDFQMRGFQRGGGFRGRGRGRGGFREQEW